MNQTTVPFSRDPGGQRETVEQPPADAPLEERIIAALRGIYDPELPVNIYDLGLIYEINVNGRDVHIVMTLTSPNCPVAGSMPSQVECVVQAFDEVDHACVELTWDPPWDSNNLSDEVKLTLGLL